MFGYPSGVGALIVRNSSAHILEKRYFGGGTVDVALASTRFFQPKMDLSQRFEDGTVNFYAIAALSKGFDDLNCYGGIKSIQRHTYALALLTFNALKSLRHGNGAAVVRIYCHCPEFGSSTVQGPIVNFNLYRQDGSCVGYVEAEKMAELYGIELRTGCFCNQGACQQYLDLTDQTVIHNFQEGKVCGDSRDMVDGRPIGSIRISFGRQSSSLDVYWFLRMIHECFVQSPTQPFSGFLTELHDPGLLDCHGRLQQRQSQIVRTPSREYGVRSGRKRRERRNSTGRPVLTAIRLYPVKSCASMDVSFWNLSATGLQYDRCWMVASTDGVTLSQKTCPRLCFIHPTLDTTSGTLILTAPELTESNMQIRLNKDEEQGSIREQRVCADRVSTIDCGDGASAWMNDVLDFGCRLRQQTATVARFSKRHPGTRVSLTNEAQYLLVNRASVGDLSVLVEREMDDLVDRFRPNFVVDGLEPFVEDTCTAVVIGRCRFTVVGLCTRCQMICVDQTTGQKEPALMMALRDRRRNKPLTFGVYLSNETTEGESFESNLQVAVGDPVILIH